MNGQNIDAKDKSKYVVVFLKNTGACTKQKTLTNAKGYIALLSLAKCVSEPIFFPTTPQGATAPSGPGPSHCRNFTITLRHTILGRTRLDA
jgi:hypothetical protein